MPRLNALPTRLSPAVRFVETYHKWGKPSLTNVPEAQRANHIVPVANGTQAAGIGKSEGRSRIGNPHTRW